eukprot:scaffold83679_cov69-Phaeocystis_antarctica.AAC.1
MRTGGRREQVSAPYGAIVRRGDEKTTQNHRSTVAEGRSGAAMWATHCSSNCSLVDVILREN